MGFDYVLIAGILLYTLTVRVLGSTRIKTVTAASIVVGGYFLLSCVVKGISYHAYGISLWQLLSISSLTIVILQFIAALFIFAKMQHDGDDSYGTWFGWGVIGLIVIFFAIPMIISRI